MAELARATGSGRDAAVDVRGLISLLGLPQHIAEFGIGERELRRAADDLADKYPAEDLLEIYVAALYEELLVPARLRTHHPGVQPQRPPTDGQQLAPSRQYATCQPDLGAGPRPPAVPPPP